MIDGGSTPFAVRVVDKTGTEGERPCEYPIQIRDPYNFIQSIIHTQASAAPHREKGPGARASEREKDAGLPRASAPSRKGVDPNEYKEDEP